MSGNLRFGWAKDCCGDTVSLAASTHYIVIFEDGVGCFCLEEYETKTMANRYAESLWDSWVMFETPTETRRINEIDKGPEDSWAKSAAMDAS